MPFRVVMDRSTHTPMVIEEGDDYDEETPMLDKLLKIDDELKRQCALCRMLLFKRHQMQREVFVATMNDSDELSNDAHKRDRFSYANAISCVVLMDRGTIKMMWELASA